MKDEEDTKAKMDEENKTVRKDIRYPSALYERLEWVAKENGSNFSATVIDMLEHGSVIVVSEGREIAALLFEISQLLRGCHNADSSRIRAATDRLVDIIEEIYEQHLKGGKDNGYC